MSAKKNAFTLIELLVTVAIIVVLAALLTPSLSKAIKRTQQVKCANNLRQIYTTCILYSQDNNGKLPNCTSASSTWVQDIVPYLEREGTVITSGRHNGVLACPASKNLATGNENSDYAKNYYAGGQFPQAYFDKQHHTDLRLINVAQPSKVILIADSDWRDLDYQTQSTTSNGTITLSRIVFRHGEKGIKGTANVAFLDGHLEILKSTDAIFTPLPSPSAWYQFPLNPTADEL